MQRRPALQSVSVPRYGRRVTRDRAAVRVSERRAPRGGGGGGALRRPRSPIDFLALR